MSTTPNCLYTARLVLRPPCPDDVEGYFAFARDPRYAFFAFDGEVTRERIARFLERYIVGPPEVHPMFVIEHEGELVGSAQLDVDGPNRLASLGYGVSPGCWGRGLATEAARAVVEHGFKSFGLDKIWARVDPRNSTSIRVLEKLGMQREGVLRQHLIRRGERVDRVYYGLLRQEWAFADSAPAHVADH